MAFQSISSNKPSLGGVVSSITPSVVIAPVVADKPYIMGSAVIGTAPATSGENTKAFVGAGANIRGVMCLGAPQIQQRGTDGIVRSGYGEDYNQVGANGAFWAALDLANFTKADVDALTAEAKLSVDSNGVFSYSATAPAGNTEVTSNVVVLNYFDKAIIPAINESVTVGATTTTFNYTKGIGAILLVIK